MSDLSNSTSRRALPELRAAIDLGSATSKLLILRGDGERWSTELDLKFPTRLGEGVQPGKNLPLSNQARCLRVLAGFLPLAQRAGVEPSQIALIATAVVRNASNGLNFLKKIKALGFSRARILSGDEEAQLGYAGAVLGLRHSRERLAVVDFGGGSFQVSLGQGAALTEQSSIQFGSHRLIAEALPPRKLTSEDFIRAELILKREASLSFAARALRDRKALAIGGTPHLVSQYFRTNELSRKQIETFRNKLAALTLRDRVPFLRRNKKPRQLAALGLSTARGAYDTGVILPALATIWLHAMDSLGAQRVSVSRTDARHALLLSPP